MKDFPPVSVVYREAEKKIEKRARGNILSYAGNSKEVGKDMGGGLRTVVVEDDSLGEAPNTTSVDAFASVDSCANLAVAAGSLANWSWA